MRHVTYVPLTPPGKGPSIETSYAGNSKPDIRRVRSAKLVTSIGENVCLN